MNFLNEICVSYIRKTLLFVIFYFQLTIILIIPHLLQVFLQVFFIIPKGPTENALNDVDLIYALARTRTNLMTDFF